MTTIHRLPQVLAECGKSRSALYDDISKGLWSRPVKLGLRAAGWPAHEVATINRARIAGKTASEIRELVARLEASRKVVA